MIASTKRYVGYIRVSTVKQGQTGSSLQEQRTAIEAYARRNNLSISEWYEETVTAAKRGRSAFTRMLKTLESGKAQGIVIHKIDRSARNLRDWADLADLIDRGADVHFAHDALDLRSRGGRLSADIQAVVAADFIRNLREETRKGFYGRLHQGLYPLAAPIGYLDKGRGNTKEIDPVKGPLIQQAFNLYATGEYTFSTLQEEMHRRGLRGKMGKRISLNGYTTILNNPFYFGLIALRTTGETFEGKHPALISKATYDAVQRVLRGEHPGRAQRHDFLFRKLLRCSRCGYRLIGERQKRRYVYYRCHSKGCEGGCVSESAIEKHVADTFGFLNFGPEEWRDLRDLVEEERNRIEYPPERFIEQIRCSIAQCEERLIRLDDVLLDGLLDRSTYTERKAKILTEKRGYLERLASPPRSLADLIDEELELTKRAYFLYQSEIFAEKREALLLLTSNFFVSGKMPVLTLKSPFKDYIESQIGKSSVSDFVSKSSRCDLDQDEPRTRIQDFYTILKKFSLKKLSERGEAQEKTRLLLAPANDNENTLDGAA